MVTVWPNSPDQAGAVGPYMVTVDDDGPGIGPDDLARVFDRFYQADRGPNRPLGSGLGLAIVAEPRGSYGARGSGRVTAELPRRFALCGGPHRALDAARSPPGPGHPVVPTGAAGSLTHAVLAPVAR